MSGAFCVFGVSLTECRRVAERKTPTSEKIPDAERVPGGPKTRELTIQQWAARRDALAAELFATTDRRKKVSPEFDAPQFCASWLAVDPAHVRLPLIMARGPKIDKKGDVVIRKGAPVETWIEYTNGGAA